MADQGFDIQAARKAGYSDDDILSHLTQTRKFDVDGAIKAGHSKADVIDYLATTPAKAAATPDTAAFGVSRKDHPVIAGALDFAQGAGESVYNLARGASQIVHHVAPVVPELPAAPTNDTGLAKAGNVAGVIATPLPGGAASRTAGFGARMLRLALQGGAMAGLQPVENGKPEDFVKDKAKQVATGAVVAPAVGAAVEGAGKVIAKAVNSRAGDIPQDAAELIEAGKKHGVRLTYGDISRNPIVQKTETAMESVPVVGMAGERTAQQAEAKAAAEKVVESRHDQFLKTDPGLIRDVKAAAESGDVRAKHLLEQLKNAGEDPDKVLQTSIGLGDFRTRQEAEHLYDSVEDLVKKNALPDVPLKGTAAAVDRALNEAKSSKLPDKQLIGLLSDIKAGISPKSGAKPPNPFPEGTALWKQFNAQPAAAIPAGNDYAAIRQLRSDLGNKIQMYMSGENGIIGEKGVGQLQAVKNAIEGDLTDFTQKSGIPEIQRAAKVADDYYKTARAPYKDQMLAGAATDKEPDQIFQRFIQAGKGDRAERFFAALDPKGQAAVRYKIVASAVDKATNEATGVFSPQKYFTAMTKVKDATRVFYQGAGEEEIDGFNNLMAHVTRAGSHAENPPTGNRLIPFLLGGGAVGAIVSPAVAKGAAVLGGMAGVTKLLFTTDAGKSFLLAASKLPPGSVKMASLLNQVSTKLPVIAAREAAPEKP
jgi:hypothetical protein